MSSDLGKFREQMNNLVKFLESCSPGNKELEKNKLKLETGMKYNPRATVELFVDSVTPHADHILRGDDEYFIRIDAAEMGVEGEYVQFANQLKTLWTKLNDEQHDKVKRYFKLLLMLGAIATRNEQLRVIINKYRDVSNPLTY